MLVTMPLSAGPRHLLTTTHARNCRYFSLTGIFRLFTCSRHTCLVLGPGRRFYALGNFVRGGKLVFLDEGNYSLRAGPNWSTEEEVLCNRFPAPVNHHRSINRAIVYALAHAITHMCTNDIYVCIHALTHITLF